MPNFFLQEKNVCTPPYRLKGLYGESKLSMCFTKFHIFRNNFLLEHARNLIFGLQIDNMVTKKCY